MDRLIHRIGGEDSVQPGRERTDSHIQKFLEPCADIVECQKEGGSHDEDEHGDGRELAGEDPVDALAADLLLALPGLHHGLLAEPADEQEPHVGDGRRTVQSPLLFHLYDHLLDGRLVLRMNVQGLFHPGITLHQLACRKPHRDPGFRRVVLDEVHDAVEAPVQRPVIVFLAAEVLAARFFLIFGNVDGMIHQLLDALVLRRGNGHHRHLQDLFHLIDADVSAVSLHLIHHIQSQHHGDVQFHQLHGEVQVPLQVGGVHDVDDGGGLLLQDELPGHDLLTGVGGQRIDPRKVGDLRLRVPFDGAALAVYRDPREVPHVLVGSRQLIEQSRLAAVLVTGQCEGQMVQYRTLVFFIECLGFPFFTQSGMGGFLFLRCCRSLAGSLRNLLLLGFVLIHLADGDVCRIIQAQGETVALDRKLHGISQGCVLHQRYLLTRDQAHVQEVLTQCAASAHLQNGGGMIYLQIT